MPGKVNPVIPEAVTQAAILAIGRDQALTTAAAMGSLELNPFLPLVAHCLLENLDLLSRACDILVITASPASKPTKRGAGGTWRTPPRRPRRSCRSSATSARRNWRISRGQRERAEGDRAGGRIRHGGTVRRLHVG